LSWRSGEGWYWSATLPTVLYIDDGPLMLRFDVASRQFQTVFDVRPPDLAILAAYLGPDPLVWC